MTPSAYYNEIDEYAAAWLRNLIAAGHIAPGDVDTRSIEDVRPDDLRGYTQYHFFAGIGVWSYALRRAGWPDARAVWTGSCPCQPFSAAGKGAGFDDERHLWPAFHHLIHQRRPPVVLGEQVASKDADPWIDLVQTDMEALGYGFGAVPFPAAGIGAPHIRDRLYWVADADAHGWDEGVQPVQGELPERAGSYSESFGLGHADNARPQEHRQPGELHLRQSDRSHQGRLDFDAGVVGGLADAIMQQRQAGQPGVGDEHATGGRLESAAAIAGLRGDQHARPTNGHWRDADWLFCRDGKWRPVEPGTFPLANGSTGRVGRLRAYGNAIVAQAAQTFIEAVMECRP